MRHVRSARLIACVVVVLVVASGCAALRSANRYVAAPGTATEPFWCRPTDGEAVTLNGTDCQSLSGQLDFSLFMAHANLHVSDATAHGATGSAYVAGVGAAYRFSGPTSTFDYQKPDTLLYDGTLATSQVAGVEFNVAAPSAPDGFVGPDDVWTDIGGGVWQLRVWILRPFQNQPNVFATSHPCLGVSTAVYDITAPCYAATHPDPLEILVSNDDGYNAPGIDAAVEALRGLPHAQITVSAPATNKSGTGASTSPDPLTVTDATTLSGYPAKAVAGFPADSVRYALRTMHVNPDLLVSGINNGQNLSKTIIPISGTVGAARVAGRDEIPSIALSQGNNTAPDYASGAAAMLEWVNDFLLGRVGPPLFQTVVNVNIPTCTTGTNRGLITVPAAPDATGAFAAPDCTSTVVDPPDDVAGFHNGYVTVTSIGT